jgi:hypothetical protein
MVDQLPMILLPNIVEAIDRGVTIQIIESKDQVLEPDFSELTSEESRGLTITRSTPLVERRIIEDIGLLCFLTDSNCILCFPLKNEQYDYKGFLCNDEESLDWCNELYNYYWVQAHEKIIEPVNVIRRGYRTHKERITVKGQNNLQIDAQAVQDAVDNYNKVILSGTFNLGTSSIKLSKDVIIRGEGRENNFPQTRLYKKGWNFPFRDFTGLFETDENDLDISIINLNISDFNCSSILARMNTLKSIKVLNNRITLPTGFGRGLSLDAFGDMVQGVIITEAREGGVLIEGNYIDFAERGMMGGKVSKGGLEDAPDYRPDLFNHEYYIGVGIIVQGCNGKVEIKNNVIRNANGRGIAAWNHLETANVEIVGNTIESEVYGSYPLSSRESGSGIIAQTGLRKNTPNYDLLIENNIIKLEKVNQSGIICLGPTNERSAKLKNGVIRNNSIYLKNGYEGIHLRKCDDFNVSGNKISGNAYYGIRISGHPITDLRSNNNYFNGNNLAELSIKGPDDYVLKHLDGKYFTETEPKTASYWFDKYSKNNQVRLSKKIVIIDEGENNKIIQNR